MRIIRKGPPWSLEAQCLGCHSLLLIEEGDITLEPSRQAHNNDFGETAWECPVCNLKTVVEVPQHLKDLARTKARWNVGQ